MWLDVNGSAVFAHTGGAEWAPDDRPVVLLVHGAGNDHTVWRYQTRRLAGMGRAVLAIDLPGHGRSGGEALGDLASMADWAAALLRSLDQTHATVVGHSMGSLVAVQAAMAHPKVVGRIGLVATSPRMGVHPALQSAADARDPLAIDLIVGWTHTGASRFGGHRQAGVNNTAFTRRLLERHIDVLGTDLSAVAGFDGGSAAEAAVSRGPIDAIVVSGERDKMTSVTAGAAMADLLACPLHVVPDGSHASLYDHPDAVNADLLPWILR